MAARWTVATGLLEAALHPGGLPVEVVMLYEGWPPSIARRSVACRLAALAVLAATIGLSSPGQAQAAGRGFLFAPPEGGIILRGGFLRANASSGIFVEIDTLLSLGQRDFDAFALEGEIVFAARPRIDFVVGASYAKSSKDSEFEHFVDTDNVPIEQTTTLGRFAITVGAKLYLVDRGRQIGSLAWIPSKLAPYLGAGAGLMHYSFKQSGSFIDFQTDPLEVFDGELRSDDFTPTTYLAGGLDYSLSPRLALTGEARYTMASADMNGEFVNYDRIDLSGVAFAMGLHLRF